MLKQTMTATPKISVEMDSRSVILATSPDDSLLVYCNDFAATIAYIRGVTNHQISIHGPVVVIISAFPKAVNG